MRDAPSHSQPLAGQLALVTGGSQGIGAAIVARLLTAGADVVIAARKLAPCEALAKRLEASKASGAGRAFALSLDVTDAAAVAAAPRAIADLTGDARPVTLLINNAGAAVSAPLAKSSDALFLDQMAVNFHGAQRLTAALLPGMLVAGTGRVVNVASSAGLFGYAYVAAYCAAKHALVGYTRAAALELAPKGIFVRALCPHYVDTPLLEASVETVMAKTKKTREEARAFFAAENPSGRLVTPDEVADAALAACTHTLAEQPPEAAIQELGHSSV